MTILEIWRARGGYRFNLKLPDGASITAVSATLSRDRFRAIQEAIEEQAVARKGNEALVGLGRLLYQLLVPVELHDALEQIEDPLVITTDAPEIPWELVYDGKDFLGMRFAVIRRDANQTAPDGAADDERLASILLVANPTEDLPSADSEMERIAQSLPPGISQRVLCRQRADILSVSLELQSGQHSIVHFAGHAERAGEQASLLLADGALPAQEVRKILRGHPIVFLNTCKSIDFQRRRGSPTGEWMSAGLAGALLQGGARAVVATLWDAPESAAEVAVAFYHELISGVPVAEALRRARVHTRDRESFATWALYVLYGNPNARVVLDASALDDQSNNESAAVAVIEPEEEPVPAPSEAGGDSEVADAEQTAPEQEEISLREEQEESEHGPLPPLNLEELLQAAQKEAAGQEAHTLGLPHLVIALTERTDGELCRLLHLARAEADRLRTTLRARLGTRDLKPVEKDHPPLPLGDRLEAVLDRARALAEDDKAQLTELHLIRSILQETEGASYEILGPLNLGLFLGDQQADQPPPLSREKGPGATSLLAGKSRTPLLDEMGRDLILLARQRRLRPLIGRKNELRQVLQILTRKAKNNPVLIGDAGVGKTAIVEGLAQLIAAGKVPPEIRQLSIVELGASQLVAGTKYRGEFEERLKQVLDEAMEPDIVVFIDELHQIVGAGTSEGNSIDASNIMKPPLARGDIRLIGATTTTEYRRYIESDAALERRFAPILVSEPTPDETQEMLRAIRSDYESFHGVSVSEAALVAAVDLSVKFIPDRRMPDKAIELLDDACASVKLRSFERAGVATMVDEASIADIVSNRTGIPVGQISKREAARLGQLEELLSRRIIGQPEAISVVVDCIRQARAGLKEPDRPVGVFLFTGLPGTGKTELAKAVAAEAYGSERFLVWIRMSEYGDPNYLSRLVGAPAVYAGGGSGEGELTGALRSHPHSVVLFDEVEKAHPSIMRGLLHLFDEGSITDGHGRLIDGTNAVFIMTSNLGTTPQDRRSLGFTAKDNPQQSGVPESVRQAFPPEFLDRITVVAFRPLGLDQLREITKLRFGELQSALQARNISCSIEDAVLDNVAELTAGQGEGARNVQRNIDRLVKRQLSRLLLSEKAPQRVLITSRDGQVAVEPGD